MKIHELKTWPEYYQAVARGNKTFEVRKNDRDFQVGDYLDLHEWDPTDNCYTGAVTYMRVTYVLLGGVFGIEPGFCVLGMTRKL